jgi:Fe-S cluster assembly iron-binding protein IscA
MPIFKLDPVACEAIKTILSEKGLPFSVRIEIRSTGCCDASLGIAAETAEAHDLIEEVGGLAIAMNPAIHQLVGDVSISCVDDSDRKGFVLLSGRSLNEWAGFAPSSIRI